jgi:hypothetical protein
MADVASDRCVIVKEMIDALTVVVIDFLCHASKFVMPANAA